MDKEIQFLFYSILWRVDAYRFLIIFYWFLSYLSIFRIFLAGRLLAIVLSKLTRYRIHIKDIIQ